MTTEEIKSGFATYCSQGGCNIDDGGEFLSRVLVFEAWHAEEIRKAKYEVLLEMANESRRVVEYIHQNPTVPGALKALTVHEPLAERLEDYAITYFGGTE